MYISKNRPGPQVGGPLTVWHTHCDEQDPCLVGGLLVARENRPCPGVIVHDWMLHVWLVPNRLGPFGHEMVAPVTLTP
jgi:hypothetical protein